MRLAACAVSFWHWSHAMSDTEDYKAKRLEHREHNAERARRLLRRLPELRNFCAASSIEVRELPGSYQFKRADIALSWWPSSNKIAIQWAGHNEAEPFEAEPTPDEPKILKALKWLALQ